MGLHQRTLLAYSLMWFRESWNNPANRYGFGRTDGRSIAYVFYTWNKRQAAIIWPPETSWTGQPGGGPNFGRRGAVWQESDSIAWLFIGSDDDRIVGATDVGSLYIYRLDWSKQPLEVRMVKRLVPPESEFSNNNWGVAGYSYYSSTVSVSNDGLTLALAAQGMNNLGAVYVYTRPGGPAKAGATSSTPTG